MTDVLKVSNARPKNHHQYNSSFKRLKFLKSNYKYKRRDSLTMTPGPRDFAGPNERTRSMKTTRKITCTAKRLDERCSKGNEVITCTSSQSKNYCNENNDNDNANANANNINTKNTNKNNNNLNLECSENIKYSCHFAMRVKWAFALIMQFFKLISRNLMQRMPSATPTAASPLAAAERRAFREKPLISHWHSACGCDYDDRSATCRDSPIIVAVWHRQQKRQQQQQQKQRRPQSLDNCHLEHNGRHSFGLKKHLNINDVNACANDEIYFQRNYVKASSTSALKTTTILLSLRLWIIMKYWHLTNCRRDKRTAGDQAAFGNLNAATTTNTTTHSTSLISPCTSSISAASSAPSSKFSSCSSWTCSCSLPVAFSSSLRSALLSIRTLSSVSLKALIILTGLHRNSRRISASNIFTFTVAALFIAISLGVSSVSGGYCWQTALSNGKCNQIYNVNVTKAECCINQEFSYTEKEYTSVEYFFATAIGGGMECAPCAESCQTMQCGADKKCVKRKGRPKCICAPECGAAARRRKQQEQQQPKVFRGHEHHIEQVPREIRSLSSEISNINLGLSDNHFGHFLPTFQDQRKMLNAQSQHQSRRLLLIDNASDRSGKKDKTKSTTRRLQILSNVGDVEADKERGQRRQNKVRHYQNPKDDGNESEQKLLQALETGVGVQQQQPGVKWKKHRQHHHKHNHSQKHPRHQHRHRHRHHHNGKHHNHNDNGLRDPQDLDSSRNFLALNFSQDPLLANSINPPSFKIPHPVCGTDGRTYKSECQLKKRSCRTNNANLKLAYRGHCKTSCNGVQCLDDQTCIEDQFHTPYCIECKLDCPEDNASEVVRMSDAVCGVDGQTYKSICDIRRMICKIGRSIAVAYPGPCRADTVTCDNIKCGPNYKCLLDLKTHEPRCVYCRHKCSRKRQQLFGQYESTRICGNNNLTYNSVCEMRKDSCKTGYFIDIKHIGECN